MGAIARTRVLIVKIHATKRLNISPGNDSSTQAAVRRAGSSAELSKATSDRLAQNFHYAELIAEAAIRQVIRGNVQAVREIADRTEGKPRQSLEIEYTRLRNVFDRMTREELEQSARGGPWKNSGDTLMGFVPRTTILR
jgi:hypothetical protein